MIRTLSYILGFLILFIIFASAVTGDLNIPAETLLWAPFAAAGALLCGGIGIIIGSETPQKLHKYCYEKDCSHKRTLNEYEEIRHQVRASHRKVRV
jgi:hypothetical protein